jgi:hypothetical protein
MKIIYLITLLLAFHLAHCQNSFEGTLGNDGYYHSYGSEFIETTTHEHILIGGTIAHMGLIGYNFIDKFDQSGNQVWKKTYPPPCGQAGGGFIRELNNGNYLLSSYGSDFCHGGGLLYSYFIISDTAGNFLNTVYLGGNNFDFRMRDVQVTLDGGFVTTGTKQDSNYIAATITKYDSNGNLIFQKEYLDSAGWDFYWGYNCNDFVKVIQFPDSSYYILGTRGGHTMIFHLDPEGDSISTIPIGDTISNTALNYIQDFKYKDGKIYCSLATIDNGLLVKNFIDEIDPANGDNRIAVYPYTISCFFPLDNGNKLILNYCLNSNPTGDPSFDDNSYIHLIDSNQNDIWTYCVHPQYLIRATRFMISDDQGVLLASAIDSAFGGNSESIYYLRLDQNGTVAVTEITNEEEKNVLFPNPATTVLYFSDSDKLNSATIKDSQGRAIGKKEINLSEGMNIRNLNSGIYFIELNYQNRIIVKQFVKY